METLKKLYKKFRPPTYPKNYIPEIYNQNVLFVSFPKVTFEIYLIQHFWLLVLASLLTYKSGRASSSG